MACDKKMPKTPECSKLHLVKEKSQAIGEFLVWLRHDKGYVICRDDKYTEEDAGEEHGVLVPACINTEQLLAEYFEIDLKKVEKEKLAILKAARAPEVKCCNRAGEYNGFGGDGPLLFTCPKHCSCHD